MFQQLASIAALSAVAAAGILDECINITTRDNWLVADCLTGNDVDTRINSAVYYRNKFANIDGVLTALDSGFYYGTCRDCTVAGVTLSCSCRPNFGSQYRATTINLEEHIANYQGHLLSNLTSQPQVPATSSPIRVPETSLTYSFLYGSQSCYSTDPSYPYCDDPPVSDPEGCTITSNWGDPTGLDCFALRWPVSVEVYATFQALSPSNRAWEYTVFADEKCSPGEELGVAPAETCTKFARRGVGIAARPRFNADWRV